VGLTLRDMEKQINKLAPNGQPLPGCSQIPQMFEAWKRVVENTSQGNLAQLAIQLKACRTEFERYATRVQPGSTEATAASKTQERVDGLIDTCLEIVEKLQVQLQQDDLYRESLRNAGTAILAAYKHVLPQHVQEAVNQTFIASPKDSRIRCFRSFDHEIEEFQRRVSQAECHEGIISGYTPSFAYPGIETDPEMNIQSSALAPLNRRIEVCQTGTHTVAHEMIHWCCSEPFRTINVRGYEATQFKWFFEGFTEWLTRNALNEWNTGGYGNFMTHVKYAIKDSQPSAELVMKAYFLGEGIEQATSTLINVVSRMHSDVQYMDTFRAKYSS
jgi:hypothetical protein